MAIPMKITAPPNIENPVCVVLVEKLYAADMGSDSSVWLISWSRELSEEIVAMLTTAKAMNTSIKPSTLSIYLVMALRFGAAIRYNLVQPIPGLHYMNVVYI